MKLLMMKLLMSSLVFACNAAVQNPEASNTRTEKEPKTPPKEDEEVASMPVVVTGSFLTCSWTSVGKDNSKENAVGCNLLNEKKEIIKNPNKYYTFDIQDQGKDISGESITIGDQQSTWSILIKSPHQMNYISTALEVIATPFQEKANIIKTKLPPCDYCEMTGKLGLVLTRYNDAINNYMDVLKEERMIRKMQIYTQNQVSNCQNYYANPMQLRADECQKAANGQSIQDMSIQTACANQQSVADIYQNKSTLAQNFTSELQSKIDSIDSQYSKVWDTLDEIFMTYQPVIKSNEDLNEIHKSMTCNLEMKTFEDYIKCAEDDKFKQQIANFNKKYSEVTEGLDEFIKVLNSSDRKFLTSSLSKTENQFGVFYKNYFEVLTNYCNKSELKDFIQDYIKICSDFKSGKNEFGK